MSDFYVFGKHARDFLRGLLQADELPSLAEPIAISRCSSRESGDIMAYLSRSTLTIWVRKDSEATARKSLQATEVSRGKWRIATDGDQGQEFTVEVVDSVPSFVSDDPKPGDKRTLKDHDCTGVSKKTDTGCKNQGERSWREITDEFKFCETAVGKTCNEEWKQVGQRKWWSANDCKGDPNTIYYAYTWRCD